MVFTYLLTFYLVLVSVNTHAQFPSTFKWCTATAAHQVEGNNIHSDWWDFENTPGHIENNEKSGKAVDQWNLIAEDIQRMKSLGVNSYRFSVEWAKIQPTEDTWDLNALKHYKLVVKQLKEAGIEPLVTLHHFTLPQWMAQKGGWSSPLAINAFTIYSAKVFEALKDDVIFWVTFNEPTVLITAGYLDGIFPPQKKGDQQGALLALKNILSAHGETVAKLRTLDIAKKAKFGFAHHLRIFDPANKFNPFDWWMANKLDQIWNWSFTDALTTGKFSVSIPLQTSITADIPNLIGSQDFFGLNYYSRDMIGFSFSTPYYKRSTKANTPTSDLGWEIYPKGLGLLLNQINQKYPALPILITENGVADATDEKRVAFLQNHLIEVEAAIANKIPVIGYCYWSLLDNFEWAKGFSPRFGLYEVTYSNLQRTKRKSANYFEEVIRAGTTGGIHSGKL